MKIIVLLFISTNLVSSFPIDYDQIIFPDDNKLEKISNKAEELKFERKNILDDINLLKSENTTEEFFYDKDADSKFEQGNHFQGDIVLLDDQREYLNNSKNDNSDAFGARTGLIWEGYRWPKNKYGRVTIPYEISNVFSHNDKIRIILAMNDLQRYTCVQFIARTNERDFIHIYSGDGCFSNIGRIGGMQYVSLQRRGCMARGTILHELIHTIGYDHMQNHPDRDNYVYILWNNIIEKQKSNFRKGDFKKLSNFGTSYDYYSVMHYEPYTFSKNGKPTIIPTDSNFYSIIGQRNSLSAGDAKRINNMYKC